MTRGDGIGKHRPVMGPVEINATCRFEACPQWVAILKHITKSPGSERGIVCFNMVRSYNGIGADC